MKRIASHLVKTYFYKLTMNSEYEQELPYHAMEDNLKGFDFRQFATDQTIINWPSDATVYVLGDVPTDFMLGSNTHIISERCRQVIENLGVSDVQFLPIRAVHKETQAEVGTYWVIKANRLIEGLDWEHTVPRNMQGHEFEEKYPKEKYPFMYIMEPVLNWEKVKGEHVFQITANGKVHAARPVYVSSEVREELILQGFDVGLFFIKVPAH
jgi:hypothetical protein